MTMQVNGHVPAPGHLGGPRRPPATRSGLTTRTPQPRQDAPPARSAAPRRPGFEVWGITRSQTNRVIVGVAGGLAERLGVDPILVRIAFVLLTIAGGVGLIAYLLLAFATDRAGAAGPTRWREPTRRRTFSFVLIVAGIMLLLRELGLWFGDRVVWPVALAAIGSAVIWARGDDEDRAPWLQFSAVMRRNPAESLLGDRASLPRVVVGALLVASGMGYVLATSDALATVGSALLAIAVTAAGLGLILGPWILRLYRQLTEERRERIRSEERAEMAAHLHDSVLHTLALIQRADAPMEMVTLARRQERELRQWLYAKPAPLAEERL